MNQLTIMGYLGADPEVRFTSSGQKVTTLRVAENQRRSGKEETLWWRVTIWGEQFDKMLSYLKKGSAVIVAGEMSKPEIYNDRDGHPQISLNMTAHHVAFSPFGKSEKHMSQQNNQSQGEPVGAGKISGTAREDNVSGLRESPYFQQESGNQMSQGQAEPSFNNLSDDEIPF